MYFIPVIFSLFFLSQGVMFTYVATPLYFYFIAFVMPSKVLVGVDARFGFLHRNRFYCPPFQTL